MTPHRTSRGGSFRFDRVFPGVGRIARASGARTAKDFADRDGILTKLYDNAQLDVLRAFRRGDVTMAQLVDARRDGLLKSDRLLTTLSLGRPLWATIDATLPRMGKSERGRERYHTSLKALKARAASVLGEKARVADLAHVDWAALAGPWRAERSAADWNHLRRAISAFLSTLLDEKHHPERLAVMKHIPLAPEAPREPELTATEFWKLVEKAPEYARPCYVTLVITGMRVGEYLTLGLEHLRPESCAIQVPGTKTAASSAVVAVDPDYWPWIEAAVPSPLGYKWLRINFKNAAKAIGRADLRLHDLRHVFAQLASDAGAPTAQVQAALRHPNPATMRR